MRNEKHRLIRAVLVAVLGGLFIMGLTPLQVHGFAWHWPWQHRVVSATAIAKQSPLSLNEAEFSAVKPATAKPDPNSKFVLILMYHHVADISDQTRKADPIQSDLTVSPKDFADQVKYFHDRGYHSVTVADLYNSLTGGKALPVKPIIFTFDDGYKDVFANAIPVLESFGDRGSFAIATQLLGRPNYAQWADVIAADKSGMEILSHTENHLDLTNPVYSADDLHREIVESKQMLTTELGHTVDFFVYPYGHTNEKVAQLVSDAGYKMAFTTQFSVWISPKTMLSEGRLRVHGEDGLTKLKKVLTK